MAPPLREWSKQERLLVTFMAVAGVPHKHIAAALDTDDKTLRKHFKEELDDGAHKLNAQVVGALFKSAMGGSVAAQIFWCKTRLGWRETDRLEVEGKIENKHAFEVHIHERALPSTNGHAEDGLPSVAETKVLS